MQNSSPVAPPEKGGRARQWIQAAVFIVLWFGALFGGAGRLDWTRGWIYVVLYAGGMSAIGVIVRRVNPELLKARARWHLTNTKRFDKMFLAVYFPLTYIQPAVAGMDAARFGWSRMPFWLVYPGAVLLLLSLALIGWAMAVNRHAESTVRIQTDRGHSVVASGPYRVVRHPMYVGAILMHAATALILGSVWALALAGVIMVLYLWRTALEDKTLLRELAGYGEYSARTCFRLVPGVW